MEWLKSLFTFKVGYRTIAMTILATVLKIVSVYITSNGIVLDPLFMDTLTYAYTAALGGAFIFLRKGIDNIGK